MQKSSVLIVVAILIGTIVLSVVGQVQQASALSAITFTNKTTINSTNQQFQRVYDTSTSTIFLDASNTTLTQNVYNVAGGTATSASVVPSAGSSAGSTTKYNYSNSTSWSSSGTQVTISGGKLNFVATQGGSTTNTQRMYVTLPGQLSDSSFDAKSIFQWTARANNPIILTSVFSANTNWFADGTSNDAIGIEFTHDGVNGKLLIWAQDGTTAYTSASSITVSASTTYYPELIRSSTTSVSLYVYSDSGYTTQVAGSPVSLTIPSTITSLAILQHSNIWGPGTGNTVSATVDDDLISSSVGTYVAQGSLYASPIATDNTYYAVAKNTLFNKNIYVKYDADLTSGGTITPQGNFSITSGITPTDLTQYKTTVFSSNYGASGSGRVYFATISTSLTGYAETLLYTGTGGVPVSSSNMKIAISQDSGGSGYIFIFFESNANELRVVRYPVSGGSATLISTVLTHTTGQYYSVIPILGGVIVNTGANITYQVTTSSSTATQLYTESFNTKYPQTYTLTSSALTFNSNGAYLMNATVGYKAVPSAGTIARTGILVNSTSGTSFHFYSASKWYYLSASNTVVQAASAGSTSWTIKAIDSTRNELAATPYTEKLGVSLVQNYTLFNLGNLMYLQCNSGSYPISNTTYGYFTTGDDSDCTRWITYPTDGTTITARQISPFQNTAELTTTSTYTSYTFSLSVADPTLYKIVTMYNGKTVDSGTFDSSGELQQRLLYQQCYTIDIKESSTGNQVQTGNICAGNDTTKQLNLSGIMIPAGWLGSTWSHAVTRNFTNPTNNAITFAIQKSSTPYTVDVHVVDNPDSSHVTYNQWYNFTAATGISIANVTGVNSNQTLYFTAYENGTTVVANDISSGQGFDFSGTFSNLGLLYGIPTAIIFPILVALVFPKGAAHFGLIVVGAVIGIMGFFNFLSLPSFFWPLGMGIIAIGVMMGVKRS